MCVCTLCELRGGQYIVTSSTYYNTLYFLEQLYNVQERATHVAQSRRAHMSHPSINYKSQNKDGSVRQLSTFVSPRAYLQVREDP